MHPVRPARTIPHNLKGIEACEALLPGVPQVGVFDTAFHQTIPPKAFIYGLPYTLYKKLGIRRYGFHGTSHSYVAAPRRRVPGKRPSPDLKLITCHLGNGASITAVDGGQSVDTTMGFTPLEGLVMGTRCGDIDPALVPYIMEREKLGTKEIDSIMNKNSGMLGLTETSNDMREIEQEAARGSERHRLAIEIYCYHVRKYIGAYMAALGAGRRHRLHRRHRRKLPPGPPARLRRDDRPRHRPRPGQEREATSATSAPGRSRSWSSRPTRSWPSPATRGRILEVGAGRAARQAGRSRGPQGRASRPEETAQLVLLWAQAAQSRRRGAGRQVRPRSSAGP